MNQTLLLMADGEVRWLGVHAGPLSVHYRDKSYLVLKAGSHKYFSGVGQPQATAPVRFYVFAIDWWISSDDGTARVQATELFKFPLRAQTPRRTNDQSQPLDT